MLDLGETVIVIGCCIVLWAIFYPGKKGKKGSSNRGGADDIVDIVGDVFGDD